MAKQSKYGNAAYYTKKSIGPIRFLGEAVHETIAPIKEGVEKALSGIPLIGPALAVLIKRLFIVVEGAVGITLSAIGAPIGWVTHKLAGEKKWDEDTLQEMTKGIEPEVKAEEKEKAKEEEPEKAREKEKAASVESGPVREGAKKTDASVQADDGAVGQSDPQREMNYRQKQTIFQQSPQDVYGPNESEPQMQVAVEIFRKAEEQIKETHKQLTQKIAESPTLEENILKMQDWKNGIKYEDLAEAMFVRILDHDMRFDRQQTGRAGRLETESRACFASSNQAAEILKPTPVEMNIIRNALWKMNREELSAVTFSMDQVKFREFRQNVVDQFAKEYGLVPEEGKENVKSVGYDKEKLIRQSVINEISFSK